MDIAALYDMYRAPLFSLAYRMLGSVMDAEDIVQDAFLRFERLPGADAIANKRAYLYKIVTNGCLDLLRASARKRELYVGPWLPEPIVTQGDAHADDPAHAYMRRESVSIAYLLLLQQLNEVERAVFLLREIFELGFDDIADMVGKTSANCRQIFHRAKKGMTADPEEIPAIAVAEDIVREFVQALQQENRPRLLRLISEQVVYYADGGGKARAARRPIRGAESVIAAQQSLLRKYSGQFVFSFVRVNGMPGVRIVFGPEQQYIYTFSFSSGRIRTLYAVANPDKLRHLPVAPGPL